MRNRGNFPVFLLEGLRRNTKTIAITGAQKHHEYYPRVSGYTSLLGKLWCWQDLTLHNELKLLRAVPISNYCHQVCCLASTKIVPLSTELHVALSLYVMTSRTVATDALSTRFCTQQQKILQENPFNCSDQPCIVLCNVNVNPRFADKMCFLDFKLSPCSECCLFSFGWFPGVWFIYADVSEHSICSIFKGRWLHTCLWRWNR